MEKTVEVVPYQTDWPKLFEVEAKRIREALGSNCIAIHHIGSTSVPGLSAKPIIDILPVVKTIQEVDQVNHAMEKLGYIVKGENGIAFRRFFQKTTDPKINVHVYEESDPEVARYLKFREWMRTHPQDAKRYADLKLGLAEKFPQDITQYCLGKDAFVASIDAKDGYDGWRLVQALTDREWQSVHRLRKQYLGNIDLPTTFGQKNHIHFSFYKNAEVIGYTHLEILPNYAIIRILALEESYRHLGMDGQLLRLCERWLCHQGINKIFVHSPKEMHGFYLQYGYVDMPFEDPPVISQSIQMGKVMQ